MTAAAGATALERARRALAHPAAPFVAALAAMLLAAPSIASGLQTDDLSQRIRANAMPSLGARCFDFFSLDGPATDWRNAGVFPWWTPDDFRIAFFRPLSSLWACVDYRIFPWHPWVLHVENLLLYGAAVLAVAAALRSIASAAWVAGLAAWIWALDEAHGPMIGWIASRNLVLASLFAALAVRDHARGAAGSRAAALRAPAWLLLGLASAEAAVTTLGVLVAHAVVMERGAWTRRALRQAPYVAIVAAWQLAYRALGNGQRGSSAYVDPLASTLQFLGAGATRWPALVTWALGLPRPHAPQGEPLMAPATALALGALLACVVAIAALPALRRERRVAFFALALALSTLPLCAAPPVDRVLGIPSIAASGLCAEIAALAASAALPLASRWAAAALVGLHLLVSPALLPWRSLEDARISRPAIALADRMFDGVGPGEALVVVRATTMFQCNQGLGAALATGASRGAFGRCLSGGPSPAIVGRPDPFTVTIRPKEGFLDAPIHRLHWSGRPMHALDTIELVGTTVTILDVDPRGEPLEASFRFAVPLEDPHVHWVVERGGRVERFVPPAVGEAVELPGT